MSKRTATVQLTSTNSEQYGNEEEEAGNFAVASKEEIDQRVIRKAKRSGRGLNQDGTGLSGATGIFAGLRKSMTSSAPNSSSATSNQISFSSFSSSPSFPSSSSLSFPSSFPSSSSGPSSATPGPVPSGQYLQQLSSLNRSVSGWITKHVGKNSYVDLTPIFRDYERHLGDIDKKYNVVSGSDDTNKESSEKPSEKPSETKDISEEEEEKGERNGNENGSGTTSTTQSETQETPPPSITPPPSLDLTNSAPDTEEGVVFSTRTKLFYKKESEYVELGTGTVKVKSPSNGSVQLLLRNDTSLRKILLNVKVVGDTPISTFKKSVLVVCPTPNPPLSVGEGPVTYLLRVKTDEVAEQLLKVIKESTSSSNN